MQVKTIWESCASAREALKGGAGRETWLSFTRKFTRNLRVNGLFHAKSKFTSNFYL